MIKIYTHIFLHQGSTQRGLTSSLSVSGPHVSARIFSYLARAASAACSSAFCLALLLRFWLFFLPHLLALAGMLAVAAALLRLSCSKRSASTLM